ncbi:MAG: DNA polymerase I, partial [Bacteroidales bacterium]|nr:DNA polymerase I [Bacteroidales bacterium]
REYSQTLAQDIADLEEHIYALAGEKFNIGSPKQMGEILFEKLRIIENAKLTKTKQYQTGEEILLKLANRHPIVPLILEWRGVTKLKSTYIDALPALVNPRTGRIHTTFNQTVTSTGRLSSTNPNLQNIPIRTQRGKDIRKAFTPAQPGSVIMAADYSQIELRIVAAVSGDEEMTAAFREHRDIHAMTAAKVYRVPLDQVTSDMRRTAKTVNFGILYGISAFGLAERLYVSQKEARELISEYYNSFPKIILYLNDTMEFARAHGYVETLLHRRRYIRDIGSSNAILRKAAERNAINAPIQGTAADLIKIAMIRVDAELTRRKLKSKMILQIHDELVFEVPADEIETMKQLVPEIMNAAMTMSVPLETEVNYGSSWYDAH